MPVAVFGADEQTDQDVDLARWVRLAEQVLVAQGVRRDAEVSLVFVDEVTMADLNARHMGAAGPTDVLAFPIDEEPIEPGRWPDGGESGPDRPPLELGDLPVLLGDVVICPAVAARQAAERRATLSDELALLVVHGLLHVLGMDHAQADEALAMQAREQELLGQFHLSS